MAGGMVLPDRVEVGGPDVRAKITGAVWIAADVTGPKALPERLVPGFVVIGDPAVGKPVNEPLCKPVSLVSAVVALERQVIARDLVFQLAR